ncbi:MAG: hypothetical protein QOE57_117, partial [Acidimicrobiaceae bacterium]|nr:hypothetical protein [Acidimicrobiaceae bacterium]
MSIAIAENVLARDEPTRLLTLAQPGATGPSRVASRHPSISVVIPTLNEAQNLPYVLERLPAMVSQVIIVDGHSTDGTVAAALLCRPDSTIVMQTG